MKGSLPTYPQHARHKWMLCNRALSCGTLYFRRHSFPTEHKVPSSGQRMRKRWEPRRHIERLSHELSDLDTDLLPEAHQRGKDNAGSLPGCMS